MTLHTLHFLVHAAQRVAGLVVVKLRNTADRLPTQRGVAVLARNTESTVRIACDWLLRRTLLPLSVSLERKEKHTGLKKSSSEQVSTSVDTPIASIGLGRVEFRVSANTGTDNCTEGQFRGMFSLENSNWPQFSLILSMTRFAFARSRLVVEHSFSIHFASKFVTTVTSNPAMSAFQRKWGAFVVVEFR